MYNSNKQTRKVILPTNDLNFKRVFASPEHINISKGFLQDLASYDPLGFLNITEIQIETPYNFQEVNRLVAAHEREMMLTEVDYACYDESGIRFMLEMQKYDQTFLEERVAYNVGQKFSQLYANNDPTSKAPKYASLKPVIAVIILEGIHFKEDDVAIRFLRHHDTRFDVYKKNLNLGLEIYIELGKDTSKLPKNLKLWIDYFRTGSVCEEAPCYLQEAAKMVEMISFTKEEKELAERIERAQQTRLLEKYTAELKQKELDDKETELSDKETELSDKETKLSDKETKLSDKEAELEKGRLEIAKNLLQTNTPIDEIAKYLKLSIEVVNSLID